MEAIQREIQSRLHTRSAGSISRDIDIPTYPRQDVLDVHGELSLFGSRRVRRTFTSSGSGPWPFWFQPGGWTETNGRAAVDTVGRAFTFPEREILARGVSSRSLNPHSNVRENIARLMICVTHVGRGCRPSASQPGCLPCLCLAFALPANRRRLRPRGNRGGVASLCHFSLSPSGHCIRISPSRGEPSYETIDPIP